MVRIIYRSPLTKTIKSKVVRRELLENGLFWTRQFRPVVEKGDVSKTDRYVYGAAANYVKNRQKEMKVKYFRRIIVFSVLTTICSILFSYVVGTRGYDYSQAQSVQTNLEKLGADMAVLQRGFDGRYTGRILGDEVGKQPLAFTGDPDTECSGIRYIAFVVSSKENAFVRYKADNTFNINADEKQVKRCADLLMRSVIALR